MGLFSQIPDALIWLGGVFGGLAVILGALKIISNKIANAQLKTLVGIWFGYSYFYSAEGVHFYKEKINITRSRLRPWILFHETIPCGSEDPLCYRGRVFWKTPYVYSITFEPASGDRTFEIGRLIMGLDSRYDMIVSLNLGRSWEETVHSASAYLWTRKQLHADANEKRSPTREEESEFLRIVSRYVEVDGSHLQIQLVPPTPVDVREPNTDVRAHSVAPPRLN